MFCDYDADIADNRRLFVYRSRFFSTICVCSLCLLMLMSGGFSNILNRVAVNRAFGDLKRLQNARLSATHCKKRDFSPLIRAASRKVMQGPL